MRSPDGGAGVWLCSQPPTELTRRGALRASLLLQHLLCKWVLAVRKHVVCMCSQAGVSAWDPMIKHILILFLKKNTQNWKLSLII